MTLREPQLTLHRKVSDFGAKYKRDLVIELQQALQQISAIREQMAGSQVFRGYRSVTVGFSGLLGFAAALLQFWWLPEPTGDLHLYVGLWMGTAALSLAVAGGEMFWRAYRSGAGLAREMTILAAKQFLPCIVVGTLLTFCVVESAPEAAWMLPGLWSLIYALGVFASYRLLPHQAVWVGVYYAGCGSLCLWLGPGNQALSPWLMGMSFGIGQFLAAGILYWTLERCRG
ncbi:MAG: hypothetical protein ACE361_00410 [Aureliella sp.]